MCKKSRDDNNRVLKKSKHLKPKDTQLCSPASTLIIIQARSPLLTPDRVNVRLAVFAPNRRQFGGVIHASFLAIIRRL